MMYDFEALNEEIKRKTAEQNELFNKISEINKEKVDIINKTINKNDEGYNRLIAVLTRYKEVMKGASHIQELRQSFNKIYIGVCNRIFQKRILLKGIKFNPQTKKIGYWYNSSDREIGFSQNGLGYLRSYYGSPDIRVRCFRNIDEVSELFKNNVEKLRDIPIKSKIKKELYLKFYDLVLQYNNLDDYYQSSIKLESPIRTVVENMDGYAYSNDECSKILFTELKEQEIYGIYIDLGGYRPRISFLNIKGESIDKYTINLEEDTGYLTYKIKFIINQLPKEILDEIENKVNIIQQKIKSNEELYDKLREEFGYMFLEQVI